MNDDLETGDNSYTIEYIDSPMPSGPQRNNMRSQSSFSSEKVNNCCYCSLLCWVGALFGICPKCQTGNQYN